MFSYFFFQAEDGIRYLVRSRGLGDVYKRQLLRFTLGLDLVPVIDLLLTAATPRLTAVREALHLSLIHI